MASKNDSKDAFSLLMRTSKSKNSKKRKAPPAIAAKLIKCPICCKALPNIRLNSHLDICMQQQRVVTSPTASEKSSTTHSNDTQPSIASCQQLNSTARFRSTENNFLHSKLTEEDLMPKHSTPMSATNNNVFTGKRVTPPKPENVDAKNNAFSRMMKQSSLLFSTRKQKFHLNSDFKVTWEDHSGSVALNSFEWSNSTVVKREVVTTEPEISEEVQRQFQDLELHITSSIPSASSMPRLVHNISRLSVPVLKSILQKSIRRSKPLPAVRVALELASKSWGDLVRRLPIIILEDSTLHPDFPLAVWAMVADSKGFIPPPTLIARIMQIIFEISLCPLRDEATCDDSSLDEGELPLSLRTKSIDEDFSARSDLALVLRTILLRAQYGGMPCDVSMLLKYAKQWKIRYQAGTTSAEMSKRIRNRLYGSITQNHTENSSELIKWEQVPSFLHAKAKKVSLEKVKEFVVNGIDALSLNDLCLAGIDFHCSSVLDDVVLTSETMRGHVMAKIASIRNPTYKDDDLQSILNQAMWEFSSGVNRRSSLSGNDCSERNSCENAHHNLLKEVWNCVCKEVDGYAKNYVNMRLPPEIRR